MLLAIDPGKMTGWAVLTDGGRFVSGETNLTETYARLIEFVQEFPAGAIICEDFKITARTVSNTQAPWSLELIGVCRYFSLAYLHRPLILQKVGDAKSLATNPRLRSMGWWYTSKDGHANDAARHLLYHCVTRQLLGAETIRKLMEC